MRITVRLGPTLGDAAGATRLHLELAADATVADVLNFLAATYPKLADLLPSVATIVDGEVASPNTALKAGTEVALLQPISGGQYLSFVGSKRNSTCDFPGS